MSQRYADIIIDISHEAIDRTFQYIIPEELIDKVSVGAKVKVPFGQGNRTRSGYVISITDKASWDIDKMKSIIEVPKGSLPIEGQLIKLAEWMKNTYGSTMINALKTVMPVKEKVAKKTPAKDIKDITISDTPVESLNSDQQKVLDDFAADFDEGIRRTYLLHGVTGSGKTEVYIQCIKEVVKRGKAAIVLIPEIALTYQTVARFKNHFGDRISIINSQLSKGEKYREFQKAVNGETDVIIGPRSALFAPFSNLGLIIMDEEHDTAYKSENSPRYHARETAIYRAGLCNASVILGSATPSVGSYFKAENGEYKLWKLSDRAGNGTMAEVSIVDLRDELRLGNRSIISNELYNRMKDAFEKKEQVMLFINKRGYNSFVSCRSCGYVVKCPRCEVSLSLHGNGFMMCHYCGHIERAPKLCPKCKSKLIGGYGTGTEKVCEEVNRLFPSARVLRMDRDTTMKKGAHGEIISAFSNKKADCLVGTQMIVKGHDFADVTVVGVMLADLNLFDSDYLASERSFDLLTQAAGRAGRKDKTGNVVIQTYQPEHYAIVTAASQDYMKFYELEMAYRKLLKYPPVYQMTAVLITSKNEQLADEIAKAACDIMKQVVSNAVSEDGKKTGVVIGPGEAYISKINDVYRRVVYAKHLNYNVLREAEDKIQSMFDEKYGDKEGHIQFDYNPMNMI